MNVKLNVKDKSVEAFLSEKLLGYVIQENRGCGSTSVHNLLQDELIFKKDCGLLIGEVLVIELQDRSRGSNRALTNRYEYTAEVYDDFAIKMKLTNFKVEVSEEKSDF